jgi:eukaryotic-like serine/threonine-protein kinase
MVLSTQTVGNDRYVLGEMLGHGATAIVVRALDTKLGRDVAVKLLAENLAADRPTCERFVREAQLAARWSHPNLVQVFDVGEERGRPFMVMEYIDGPNLATDLRERGPFPPDEVAAIGRAVASGLDHIHRAGLIHRDVKPANLLRCRDGSVKMTDFGIAFDPQLTALTEVGTIVGTIVYLAPERAAGHPSSPAEDIYALGVCLYEMLAGRAPYEATTLPGLLAEMRKGSIPPLPDTVPPALASLVERCVSLDPARRPASAAEVVRALGGEVADDSPEPVDTPSIAAAPTVQASAPASPATARFAVDDAETVRVRNVPPPEPGKVTAAFGPRPVRRRALMLVGLAFATLIGVAAVLSPLGPDTPPDGAPRPATSTRPVNTDGSTEPAEEKEAPGAPASGDPAEAARELADWLRSDPRPGR